MQIRGVLIFTMFNLYRPKLAKIFKIKNQSKDVKLYTLRILGKEKINFFPGQFVEIGSWGFGEAPFAICSSSGSSFFQVCVRKVGRVTSHLATLKVGNLVTVRGPFGRGFPLNNSRILLVAGGLGIIPLRSVILNLPENPTKSVILFYGARSPKDFLFSQEFKKWEKKITLYLTIDKPFPGWNGEVGLVTTLFDKVFKERNIGEKFFSFLCGPPVMYKFVIEKLKEFGFSDEKIFLSFERRMHCGVGVCQHCVVGSKYVCKDGPVFSYQEIKEIYGAL